MIKRQDGCVTESRDFTNTAALIFDSVVRVADCFYLQLRDSVSLTMATAHNQIQRQKREHKH